MDDILAEPLEHLILSLLPMLHAGEVRQIVSHFSVKDGGNDVQDEKFGVAAQREIRGGIRETDRMLRPVKGDQNRFEGHMKESPILGSWPSR
jgi:hypothetical protein